MKPVLPYLNGLNLIMMLVPLFVVLAAKPCWRFALLEEAFIILDVVQHLVQLPGLDTGSLLMQPGGFFQRVLRLVVSSTQVLVFGS